jgi:hypothetical protein
MTGSAGRMRYWISHSSARRAVLRRGAHRPLSACLSGARRPLQLASVTVGSLLLLALAGGGAACWAETWGRYPWISLSAGNENDRIVEQGAERLVVPGGNFIDLMSGIWFSRVIGDRTRVNLDGQFTLERFDNEDGRSLVSAAVNAEWRRRFGSVWRGRLTAGGNYFADSVQETANRYHAGLEAGFGLYGSRGYLELLAGAQGRRYSNLVSLDDSGIPGTYTELGASVGATGALRPIGRLVVSGLVIGQTTDARDPTFDSHSILAQAAVRVAVVGPLWAFASALTQERSFSARTDGEDTDSYRQLGAGLEFPLGWSVDLEARYAFARYTDPVGASDDIHRFSVGITWRPGGRGTRSLLPVLPRFEGRDVVRADRPHVFRLRAPDARTVALVADFNGWDPGANLLRRSGDGWWEVEVALPAGSYQYAYWVDGDLVTPPEAKVTVDDGFGGRNGLLQVEPEQL